MPTLSAQAVRAIKRNVMVEMARELEDGGWLWEGGTLSPEMVEPVAAELRQRYHARLAAARLRAKERA